MDDVFLNNYFNEINSKLKNKRFTSKLKTEFDTLDEKKLKELIEEYL